MSPTGASRKTPSQRRLQEDVLDQVGDLDLRPGDAVDVLLVAGPRSPSLVPIGSRVDSRAKHDVAVIDCSRIREVVRVASGQSAAGRRVMCRTSSSQSPSSADRRPDPLAHGAATASRAIRAVGATDTGLSSSSARPLLEQQLAGPRRRARRGGEVDRLAAAAAGQQRRAAQRARAPRSTRAGVGRQRDDRDVVERLGPDPAEPDDQRRHDRVGARGDEQLDPGRAIRSTRSRASAAGGERRSRA